MSLSTPFIHRNRRPSETFPADVCGPVSTPTRQHVYKPLVVCLVLGREYGTHPGVQLQGTNRRKEKTVSSDTLGHREDTRRTLVVGWSGPRKSTCVPHFSISVYVDPFFQTNSRLVVLSTLDRDSSTRPLLSRRRQGFLFLPLLPRRPWFKESQGVRDGLWSWESVCVVLRCVFVCVYVSVCLHTCVVYAVLGVYVSVHACACVCGPLTSVCVCVST